MPEQAQAIVDVGLGIVVSRAGHIRLLSGIRANAVIGLDHSGEIPDQSTVDIRRKRALWDKSRAVASVGNDARGCTGRHGTRTRTGQF
jgi:hypothetical protein